MLRAGACGQTDAMGEGGLSAAEVGKEIAEHRHHHGGEEQGRDRIVTIIEASLLAIVALLAGVVRVRVVEVEHGVPGRARRGVRRRAPRPAGPTSTPMELRNLDYSTFNVWFAAWVVGDEQAAGARRAPVPT